MTKKIVLMSAMVTIVVCRPGVSLYRRRAQRNQRLAFHSRITSKVMRRAMASLCVKLFIPTPRYFRIATASSIK